MRDYETSVTEKGQVTIPQEIRRIMGLQPHDKVRFEVDGETIKISRAPSKLLELFGSVTPINRPEDFQKMREEFEKGVAEEVISEG
ncbi:MAG TPA: AbrB/MazE/SpoVT family DNA-binding domain-containing protein [Ktedonobacteraceae bacterium]|nr:AbrB/MazE/SpoVT family DNA-binding domain-containing protein [Ktedonobacteraceae bacterium]